MNWYVFEVSMTKNDGENCCLDELKVGSVEREVTPRLLMKLVFDSVWQNYHFRVLLINVYQRHGLDFRDERHENRNRVKHVFREMKRRTIGFSNCSSDTKAETAEDYSSHWKSLHTPSRSIRSEPVHRRF